MSHFTNTNVLKVQACSKAALALILPLFIFASTGVVAQKKSNQTNSEKIKGKLSEITTFEYDKSNADLGINIGFSSYTGDMRVEEYSWRQSNLAVGAIYRNSLNKWIGIRAFVNYGQIEGSDAKSRSSDLIKRNLSFQSRILEYGVAGEFNFPIRQSYTHKKGKMDIYYRVVPYVYLGVNLFHFNPKTFYNNTWVALQPLHTEGKSYSLTSIAIPLGVGVKVPLNERFSVAMELGLRKTFTDYIDDVSSTYVDASTLTSDLAKEVYFRSDELPEEKIQPLKLVDNVEIAPEKILT